MKVSYPALFYYVQSEKVPFFITFPDFENSITQGENVTDALAMASDWLGVNIAEYLESGLEVPTATSLEKVSLTKNNLYPGDLDYDPKHSFKSMVLVDLDDYLNGNEKVKKSVSIPKWADRTGAALKLNLSATLTEAIAKAKISHDAKNAR